MADNITITPGSGVTLATDDIASVHVQRMKVTWGVDGVMTDASAAAPLPVSVIAALPAGANNIGDVDVLSSALPTGAATSANQSTEITALQLLDDVVVADNAGFTDGTTKVSMNGYIYDEVAGTALTENDAAAARVNVNRSQIGIIEDGVTRARYATVTAANALKVDGSAVTQPVSGIVTAVTTPNTSGGCVTARLISAATTNATSVKASAGQLYGYALFNSGATPVYFKFYNKATAPTVGTDTPVLTLMIPPESGLNLDSTCGLVFATGIAYATTTGMADNDTVAIAAAQVAVNLWYK